MAAFVFPFELFLFAYAVFGPLHYLTEISWLEKKGYFAEKKIHIWLLVVLCVAVFAVYFIAGLESYAPLLILAAFVIAYVMQMKERASAWMGAVGIITILAILFIGYKPAQNVQDIAALLIPTIIHVFIFTGAFILVGSLKSKSKSGYLSLAVFIACAVSFFLPIQGGAISEGLRPIYASFTDLNIVLLNFFAPNRTWSLSDVFGSAAGIAVMRFIAFAYTYHYLNWFSKTNVIRWHDIPRSRMLFILALWVLSVALYAQDYSLGLKALFFLSLLHVFLEFPLNFRTFRTIFQELSLMVR
ncbi:hypothetical protein IT407_04990 [Candidatus Uhrbacteria bacterium]|nr:hypothetical protein [Candidatus Uhrbacteria bacterium]